MNISRLSCEGANHGPRTMNGHPMNIRQLAHREVLNPRKQFPLRVIAENIHSPANIGLVFRTSEALGVERIYLPAAAIDLEPRKFERTARSATKFLSIEPVESLLECIRGLKTEGFSVLALEVTNESQDIRRFRFDRLAKIALIIGTERSGISRALLAEADACLAITMHGVKTSMNVGTALAIALYEITQQWQDAPQAARSPAD